MNEASVQQSLLYYVMNNKKHYACIPNVKSFYNWECDFWSVTSSGLAHEWEIKLSVSDYNRDFTHKQAKHRSLELKTHQIPNYFWYVTYDIAIEVPDYAGHLELIRTGRKYQFNMKRPAPRLHSRKITATYYKKLARLLSFRLMK